MCVFFDKTLDTLIEMSFFLNSGTQRERENNLRSEIKRTKVWQPNSEASTITCLRLCLIKKNFILIFVLCCTQYYASYAFVQRRITFSWMVDDNCCCCNTVRLSRVHYEQLFAPTVIIATLTLPNTNVGKRVTRCFWRYPLTRFRRRQPRPAMLAISICCSPLVLRLAFFFQNQYYSPILLLLVYWITECCGN